MKEFARHTISGAAFDSSERDPPPRCHPGTRLAIVERIFRFSTDRERNKRLLWLVGPAGVGKSAIMQTLAEFPATLEFTLGASLFFSVNGRDDGSKTILTLAYQLAVKSESYRNFIQGELAKDPMLLDKALTSQFNKFITEPFIAQRISPEGHECFQILIDGLDECNSQDTQRKILDLISSFCTKYPAAPLIWVIASRPEPHITRFLSQPNITPSYMKEQVDVDNDESRKDVERYLRIGLENIRTKYQALDHFPRWPAEHDFLKLATAAGGLFAFGNTVVDYIDDPIYANPALQLKEVLDVIDETRSQKGEGKRHPMSNLDALYSRIVSKIPRGILNDTKKLLLCMISPPTGHHLKKSNFGFHCNWLGVLTADAYGVLHHLHSVLGIPSVQHAHRKDLEFRHKSFRDYLTDFERSGMFPSLDNEVHELHTQCATRILNGVLNARGDGLHSYEGILLSWPPSIGGCEEYKKDHYSLALEFVIGDLTDWCLRYGPGVLSALRLVDIQFSLHVGFNLVYSSKLASIIFGVDARSELNKLNVLHEVSIGTLKMDKILDKMGIIVSCRSEPRHLVPILQPRSCIFSHHFNGETSTGDPSNERHWTDTFYPGEGCGCKDAALQKLEDRKTRSPGDTVTTFTDVTGNYGWVHHTFPDSEDSSRTWEFIIPYQFKSTVETLEY